MKSPWEHLPQPLTPGTVIPSNRSQGEFHFTFRCADGEEYHHRVTDYGLASDAKLAMRQFCARHGNSELEPYLLEKGSGRHMFSGRVPANRRG